MAIKVVVARAHTLQLGDSEIKKEVESISEALNKVKIEYVDNAINFVFVKGIYNHADRKMTTVCLFVNKTDKVLTELHGELRMKFKEKNAVIAKSTINFDEPFMGIVNPDDALLVHLGVPVKGLTENEEFSINDIWGSFDNVRVTEREL